MTTDRDVPHVPPTDSDQGVVATKDGARRRIIWTATAILAGVALAAASAVLQNQRYTISSSKTAGSESMAAAEEIAVQMLSYTPDTADQSLRDAAERMAGPFRDSFLDLVSTVVIPGAREKNMSVVATVPASAVVSATSDSASILLFVDQSTTVGDTAPTTATSVVQMNLDRDGNRWLVTEFEPK